MGFEDVLEIGRQSRAELYNLEQDRAPALAPWELRFGLPERVDYTGAILEDLQPRRHRGLDGPHRRGRSRRGGGVVPVFLPQPRARRIWYYEALRKLDPAPFISLSSRVLPEFREYERTSTVVVNAYVGQVMSRYLGELEQSLGEGLRIMQSSGGSITARLASEQPVRTILSAPGWRCGGRVSRGGAGGIPRHHHAGPWAERPRTFPSVPGRIKETGSSNVGGHPISVPMIEIHTVGAGGGSIARVDTGGALTVGPQSAGADPAPACYGRGEQLTVSDAQPAAGAPAPRPLPRRAHDPRPSPSTGTDGFTGDGAGSE